jgi:hypothetical protein
MAHNAREPCDIGYLDQTLVFSNVVEQLLIGIDDSVGPHPSFARNSPPVVINLLDVDLPLIGHLLLLSLPSFPRFSKVGLEGFENQRSRMT